MKSDNSELFEGYGTLIMRLSIEQFEALRII